ncbi:MAG TPA: IS5 family transposase, partial [Saprospiraceae bacterium]|nr:IS5 family transposase [Saprospiraceae bacterium]
PLSAYCAICSAIADDVLRVFTSILFFAVSLVGFKRFYKTWFAGRLQGEIPEEWSENKRKQKDVDAAWTTKHGKHHYGYKNHIKVDAKSKLIDEFEVTPANIHDGQVFEELLDETDVGQPVWADSAYDSAETRKMLRRKKIGCRIHKKGARYVTLTKKQREANRYKSRTRVRVEHVFASIRNRARGLIVRSIGLMRSTAEITLQNLAYNMTRVTYIRSLERRRRLI